MQQLATAIRENFDPLLGHYDAQLRRIPGYSELPESGRRSLESRILELMIDCLETNNDQLLIDYVRERAGQVLAAGFELEWFQQAVAIAQEIVSPLVKTAAESNFVWQALNRSQNVVWHMVTARARQAEQSLRDSQQLLQTVMDNIPQAVCWKDQQLVYRGCNRAFAESAGLTTPSDVIGKTDRDMPWHAQAEAYRTDDNLILKSGTPKLGYEESQTTPNGAIRWLRTNKTLIQDARGNVTALLGTYEDITARKQAEQERLRLTTLLEATTDVVALADEQGRALYINDAGRKMMGIGADEDVVHVDYSDDAPEWASLLILGEGVPTALSEGVWSGETTLLHRDGTETTVSQVVVARRSADGELDYLATIARDITERKRLERQIQESLERRGRQVQVSTEVAQEIAAAPNLDDIFPRVVTLIKERFNYYHAQIFRYDPALDAVVLVLGYGEAGQKMLAAGHKLTMGRGVVGTAAATGQAILATDVARDEDWRPNPYLQETKGELAVPIKLRGVVLGILDVQSDQVDALSADDRLLLEGLCGQIAVAMESARLLDAVQQSEQLMRTLIDTIPDSIYAKDTESRFTLANLTEIHRNGATTFDELRGKNDFDRYPRELAEQYSAVDQSVLRDGVAVINHEERRLDDADHPRWNLSTKVPLRDNQGNIVGLVGVTRDITELKLAQEDLLVRNNQLTAFNRMGQALAQLLTVKEVVERVFQAVSEVFDARNFSIALYNERRQEISIPLTTLNGKRREVAGRPLGNGLTEYILRTRQPLLIAHDLANFAAQLGITIAGRPPRCFLGVPLISGDTALGVIAIQDLERENVYSAADRELLSAMATRAAAALENVRLYTIETQRALQLQTAAEVSRAASSILNTEQLLPQVADLMRDRFNFYYVGIFLTDEAERWAVLRAGTGEAGQRMLADGHKLKIGGNSMISQCIMTQQARIALDVGQEGTRFDNPLLPLTRSEMALPLISRGHVSGAVTIQSEQPMAFSPDDITALQSMADQVGNAVENARLYQQANTALQELNAINRRLTGEAWESYLYQQSGQAVIWAADDALAAPASLAHWDNQLAAGEITLEPDPENQSEATITAPILLRGQPIGALRLRTPLSEWDEDSTMMLANIADHIAQAVENARLVEQAERTAHRERTINEINARVRQSVDLDAILRTAARELGQSLKAARVVARIGTTAAAAAAAAAADGRGNTND